MSKKIGIVSEGVSDYYVLKHIVSRYLKEQDVYTIPLNPKQDKGKQVGFKCSVVKFTSSLLPHCGVGQKVATRLA